LETHRNGKDFNFKRDVTQSKRRVGEKETADHLTAVPKVGAGLSLHVYIKWRCTKRAADKAEQRDVREKHRKIQTRQGRNNE
jgi:hypothetical protein